MKCVFLLTILDPQHCGLKRAVVVLRLLLRMTMAKYGAIISIALDATGEAISAPLLAKLQSRRETGNDAFHIVRKLLDCRSFSMTALGTIQNATVGIKS